MGKNTISVNHSNFEALKLKTQFLNWETLIVSEELFSLLPISLKSATFSAKHG